jgi:hypothetical protein
MWKILKWFDYSYWVFLLEKPCTWTKFWCRINGHKCGPIWFSWGTEPNMKCKNCGDEL